MQEMFAKFNQWKERFQANIADLSERLSSEGKVFNLDDATDGTFVEAKESTGGFMVLSAKKLDEVREVAKFLPRPAQKLQ